MPEAEVKLISFSFDCNKVGSKSHCRAVSAVPSPIWCASNLIFIDDVSFKL